jgi:magnesium chelatase family protein
VEVPAVKFEALSAREGSETSRKIKERVDGARKIQNERYKDAAISCNAKITSDLIKNVCPIKDTAKTLLKLAFEKLGLSARAYDRILKVARTIADLEGKELIEDSHIAETIQYRSLDRKYWRN